jgi:hypothetical protein
MKAQMQDLREVAAQMAEVRATVAKIEVQELA